MVLLDIIENLPANMRKAGYAAALFAAYYLSALAGIALSFPPDYIASILPCAALLLAAAILTPFEDWWIIALVVVPAHVLAYTPAEIEIHRQLAILAALMVEVSMAVGFLKLFRSMPPNFDSAGALMRFCLPCIIAPLFGAFPGALASTYGNASPFLTIWRDWFIGDVLSYCLVTPFILMVLTKQFNLPEMRNRYKFALEMVVFTVGFLTVLASWMTSWSIGRTAVPAMLYLPLPFLAWAAVRFGPAGTFAAAIAFAFSTIYAASEGYGIFASGVPQLNMLSVQLFLMLSLTPIIFLAASVRNVILAGESEKRVEKRFTSLFEDVPIGLWMEDLSGVKAELDLMKAEGIDVKAYLDSNPSEVVRLAMLMKVTDVNHAVLSVLGASSKEELLSNIDRVFGPESIDGLKNMIVELMGESRTARSEGVNRTLDGRSLWMDVHAHPMPGSEKDWSQIIVSTSDLTERKEAEEAVKLSNSRHRDILNAIGDGLIIAGLDGVIKSANRAAGEIYGFSPRRIQGAAFADIIAKKDPGRFGTILLSIQNGQSYAEEGEDDRLDGTPFKLELKASQILFKDGPHLLLLVRDITERKEAEEARAALENQLRRAQKLEAIGTLAGGVAHDFNNLLAAIMGYGELALMKVPAESPQHEYILRILKAGERARGVVKQILSFSRQTEVEKQLLDIRPLFSETLRLMRATIPSTITIEEKFHESPLIVLADPTQMHQVMMNLATNSYHAMMDRGGKLTVSLFHSRSRAGFVEIRVSDTGHGISQEIIQRIFDPYFTTKEVGQGSGMGLAVVQGILAEHGGVAEVSSKVGRGTTVTIYLPAHQGKELPAEQAKKEATGLPWGSERVLLVDDEETIVELMEVALSQFGYKVTAFSSSVKALEAFTRAPDSFDVVISDQTMPGLTGVELAKQLLKVRKDLPIIVCTGHSEMVNMENAQNFGISSLFMKPVKSVELAQEIRKLCES